uniref:Uncharacterized protein n=1 Tax=Romanomermis culicivorax TaxID=13658 RepID=A0A915HGQ6_ROMCU
MQLSTSWITAAWTGAEDLLLDALLKWDVSKWQDGPSLGEFHAQCCSHQVSQSSKRAPLFRKQLSRCCSSPRFPFSVVDVSKQPSIIIVRVSPYSRAPLRYSRSRHNVHLVKIVNQFRTVWYQKNVKPLANEAIPGLMLQVEQNSIKAFASLVAVFNCFDNVIGLSRPLCRKLRPTIFSLCDLNSSNPNLAESKFSIKFSYCSFLDQSSVSTIFTFLQKFQFFKIFHALFFTFSSKSCMRPSFSLSLKSNLTFFSRFFLTAAIGKSSTNNDNEEEFSGCSLLTTFFCMVSTCSNKPDKRAVGKNLNLACKLLLQNLEEEKRNNSCENSITSVLEHTCTRSDQLGG